MAVHRLTKFVDLLEKQALFFPRADKLGDPFEGSYPKANIPRRPVAYGATEDELKGLSALNRRKNERWAVSCWHMNDYESNAM